MDELTEDPLGYHDIHPTRKWRKWHEREVPVLIDGFITKHGVSVSIKSSQLTTPLQIEYPNGSWTKYPKSNKEKLLHNLTYIFTAHLPFLLKGNIRMEYNTGYPQVYSWANHCFLRFLPVYWYWYRGKRGTKVFPLLKTLLNSRAIFSETKDIPPDFVETYQKNVIIPFTFGKDSMLTYFIAKDIGLYPTLVYFNEPTELYTREHKLTLIKQFEKIIDEPIYYMDNPLGNLRDIGEGWFGWELALTSWTLLSLPYAYEKKAAYIIFSNEKSVNEFFYDEEDLKVNPDYDQSAQAIEELSMVTQSLTEGEVYTTTFLQGLNDLGIVAILKERYFEKSFPYLMSCWAETEAAKHKRWCASCSKCARLYIYLTANGVDPINDAGFQDNMFSEDKAGLYNVFGSKASGTGWDAFGLNTHEQALAFYLAYKRGLQDPLVIKFSKSPLFLYVETHFDELVEEYYGVHEEQSMPPQWRKRITSLYKTTLAKVKKEIQTFKP